jgi:uncharacterized protein YbjT (DUF2867 family)
MPKALIIGASGQIARHVVNFLSADPSVQATLFLCDRRKVADLDTSAMRIVEGDAGNVDQLVAAVQGQDVVFAHLAGDLNVLAAAAVAAMQRAGVMRLIFTASLGIDDKVPGAFDEWNRQEIGEYLPPYRRAADVIKASGLNYTVLRPAWLQDEDEVAWKITQKGQPFLGTEVSRRSVADFVAGILRHPASHPSENVGISKPGTDGDKPSFA